jgi:hypothetical protein
MKNTIKYTMNITFEIELYKDNIDPKEVVNQTELRFYNSWQLTNSSIWPYGKPSDLVIGGQVVSIELSELDNE